MTRDNTIGKNIIRIVIFEIVIFLVAGIITFLVGEFTMDSYGTMLLLCGIAAMAVAIATQAGSRHRPMPYSYRSNLSVGRQHERAKKEMQSDTSFFLKAFLVGIIPVVTGLILMSLSDSEAETLAEEQKCEDVSGTWESTVEIDNSDCGFPNRTVSFTYELIQNGCELTVKGRGNKATVGGDRIYWPAGSIPGRVPGSTVHLETGVSQVSGNKATGERSWTWTDGTNFCKGKNVWSDVRLPHRDAESTPTHRDRITVYELLGYKYQG